MKLFVLTCLAAMTLSTSAFAPIAATHLPRACTLSMSVELTPEPEGGEELQAIKTMPKTRMKNMGEADDGTTSDEGTVYTFWLSTIAEGELIKQIRTQVLKDASKKVFLLYNRNMVPLSFVAHVLSRWLSTSFSQANFPGFRKVTSLCLIVSQAARFALFQGLTMLPSLILTTI